jgi:hypothetical protein
MSSWKEQRLLHLTGGGFKSRSQAVDTNRTSHMGVKRWNT